MLQGWHGFKTVEREKDCENPLTSHKTRCQERSITKNSTFSIFQRSSRSKENVCETWQRLSTSHSPFDTHNGLHRNVQYLFLLL